MTNLHLHTGIKDQRKARAVKNKEPHERERFKALECLNRLYLNATGKLIDSGRTLEGTVNDIVKAFEKILDQEIKLSPTEHKRIRTIISKRFKQTMLNTGQVNSAKAVMAKYIPDLSTTEHKGEIENKHIVLIPQASDSADDWSKSILEGQVERQALEQS